MFTDVNGAAFSVTVGPHGDALAVYITHPRFNGGNAFPVTGCTATPGAFESAQAWVAQFQTELPTALTDCDDNRHELAP
jgi:hypothetical protein